MCRKRRLTFTICVILGLLLPPLLAILTTQQYLNSRSLLRKSIKATKLRRDNLITQTLSRNSKQRQLSQHNQDPKQLLLTR